MRAFGWRYGAAHVVDDVESVKEAIEIADRDDEDGFASYMILYAVTDDQNVLLYEHKGRLSAFYRNLTDLRETAAKPVEIRQPGGATVRRPWIARAKDELPLYESAASIFDLIVRS